jgi:pimeloyl-ACP methyl ester carboxylesterase
VFFRTVRRLDRQPVRVPIPAFRPHPVAISVDGVGLLNDFAMNVWPGGRGTRSSIPWVLHNAWLVSHGKIARVYRGYLGEGPAGNPHRNRFSALGKTMSYICHDYVAFLSRADRRRAAEDDPLDARRILGRHYDLGQGWNNPPSPDGCRHWPVGRAAPRQNELVHSDVPTLVLSGGYDPVVPASMIRKMLPGLTHATYVDLPTSGHVQLSVFSRDRWCARRITTEFLRSPGTAPDTACVGRIPPLDFTIPRHPAHRAPPAVRWSRGEPDLAARLDPRRH